MSRLYGKDISTLTLESQSLLADTISITLSASAETHDTTTIGDDWREFTAGLKGGDTITHELFYDNTNTTGTWAYITGLLGLAPASATLSVSDGTRTFACDVIVTNVSMPISVADMMKFTATYQVSGTITLS